MARYAPIDVLIADDHEIFRDGFRGMLKQFSEINLLGEAVNGQELVEMTKRLKPEVIVTDINMPIIDGIEATKIIKKQFPQIGIIALSMYDEEELIIEMLESGAKGYLLKNVEKEEIIEAVKSVYKDEPYFCRNTSMKLTRLIAESRFNPYRKLPKLEFSEKELSIIRLICQQLSNKEIGESLNIGKRTVESYRESIMEKINAKNTAGIVIYAIKNNICSCL